MQLASLFNLAGPDVLIILAIVVFLFGAKKLPELARGIGQAAREFRRGQNDPDAATKPDSEQQPPQKLS